MSNVSNIEFCQFIERIQVGLLSFTPSVKIESRMQWFRPHYSPTRDLSLSSPRYLLTNHSFILSDGKSRPLFQIM